MKRTIFSLLLIGNCFTVMAQNPSANDTSRYNNGYTDSSRLNTKTPPNQLIDTSSSSVPQNSNPVEVNNARVVDTMARATPSNPVSRNSDTTSSVTATPVTETTTNTEPANGTNLPAGTGSVENAPMNNNALPRGVNNSDVVLTGLEKFSALPVLNTYVPESMVSQLKTQYGQKLYDITMLKTSENQYGYSVRLEENGMYKTVLVNDSSTSTSTIQ